MTEIKEIKLTNGRRFKAYDPAALELMDLFMAGESIVAQRGADGQIATGTEHFKKFSSLLLETNFFFEIKGESEEMVNRATFQGFSELGDLIEFSVKALDLILSSVMKTVGDVSEKKSESTQSSEPKKRSARPKGQRSPQMMDIS